MRGGRYGFFDHTGDCGVELEAQDLGGLAQALTRAFLDLLTGAPGSVVEARSHPVDIEGVDAADALVAFGNELVFLFEAEGLLAARFEPGPCSDGGIAGLLLGEIRDPARHPIARPVKAVTHHGLVLEKAAEGGLRARLVLDL